MQDQSDNPYTVRHIAIHQDKLQGFLNNLYREGRAIVSVSYVGGHEMGTLAVYLIVTRPRDMAM